MAADIHRAPAEMPSNDEEPTPSPTPTVRRARQACRRCNERKLRCDVVDSQPCKNCARADALCEVVPSRRGKYQRRSRQLLTTSASPHPTHSEEEHNLSAQSKTATPANVTALRYRGTLYNVLQSTMDKWGMHLPPASNLKVPFELFLAERTLLPPEVYTENGLDEAHEAILTHMRKTSTTDLHVIDHLRASTFRYLRDDGCLSGYDTHVTELALMEYLAYIHPFFPVLNRKKLIQQVLTGTTSLLLLTTILAVVVSHADISIARALGFEDPYHAEYSLHNRAELLFHTHAERDNITMLQSALLLSLCRGANANSSNAREWSGVAVSLGQSMRLHRSYTLMQCCAQEARTLRKLWWSIYMRERQVASFLGLPCRIREADCDIEPPRASDFESTEPAPEDYVFPRELPEHAAYFIAVVEVTKKLGQVIDRYFVRDMPQVYPGADRVFDAGLDSSMRKLLDGLVGTSWPSQTSIWVSRLRLACNHVRLLIFQGKLLHGIDVDGTDGPLALEAASEISRAVDDMIMQYECRFGQQDTHLIAAILSALFLLAYQRRAVDGPKKLILNNRAQSCLRALDEIEAHDTWDVNRVFWDFFYGYIGNVGSSELPKALKLSARPEMRSTFRASGQAHEEAGPAADALSEPVFDHAAMSRPFSMMYGPWGACENFLAPALEPNSS